MSAATNRTLHGFPLSGHAHRAELMLHLLGLPFISHAVDLRGGEQKNPSFLALNLFGQVPVLDDDGTVIADSNAILVYLASTYDPARTWLPTDPVLAADIQRWLSVAQGPVFNGPCVARLVKLFGATHDHARAVAAADALFAILDPYLTGHDFLVSSGPTIADVALYSYIAHAPEGGVSLEPWPAIRAWLARIEALPGFVGMPRSPLPTS